MTGTEYTTAIDLGSSNIVIAGCELIENQGFVLKDYVISPSQGIDQGYIAKIEHTKDSLSRALSSFTKKSGRKVTRVSFSIGGVGLCSQYVRTSIDLKRKRSEITNRDTDDVTAKAELLFSEKYPNKKILHVLPITFKVDDRDVLGSPVGMFGSSLEAKILIVTAPEHHIESILKSAEAAGLTVEDLIAAPLADAAACLSYEQKKKGVVLVNVGSETTQISTFEQGVLTSVRVVPIGSSDITNDLALGLKIPIDKAEAIKLGKDRNGSNKDTEKIIDARARDIVEAVESHLKSIKKNRLLPAGVVWTGAGSKIPNIHDLAKKILHVPSNHAHIGSTNGQTRKSSLKLGLSTALGVCKVEEAGTPSSPAFTIKNIRKNISYWLSQLKP